MSNLFNWQAIPPLSYPLERPIKIFSLRPDALFLIDFSNATMQDKLEKTAAKPQPRSARKRRSDAKSFAQVKAEIDAADARRREKSIH